MKPVLLAFVLVSCAAGAKTVAFVDLSAPHKAATPESSRPARGGNHGGACYDCPNRDAFKPKFPLTAKLLWVVESAVEVLITNTSEDPILVPTGLDTTCLLNSPAPDRRSILFTICAGPCELNNDVGNSQAATNGDYPATSVDLRPGESIVFKLPFDRLRAASILRSAEKPNASCRFWLAFSSLKSTKMANLTTDCL